MLLVSVFLLLSLIIGFVQNDVNVTDCGIIPWMEGDFAIQFYVTIYNFGNRPVSVVAEMIKCCEQISDTDVYCDHFKLIGSNMDLEARFTKNITLVYLNTYSYNRRGQCDIRIYIIFNSIRHLKSTFIKQIHFDTSLTENTYLSNVLRDYSNMECQSVDEDPWDSCLPVNCHVKYSGYRGFYSKLMNKCVEIPVCPSNNSAQQAYLWSNNQCADVNNSVTQHDIQEVLHRIENNKSDELCGDIDTISSSQKIRCHSGRLNGFTDLCDCNPGWKSEETVNWDDFIPSTVPLHMCTIRMKQVTEHLIKNLYDRLIPEDWTTVELVSFLA